MAPKKTPPKESLEALNELRQRVQEIVLLLEQLPPLAARVVDCSRLPWWVQDRVYDLSRTGDHTRDVLSSWHKRHGPGSTLYDEIVRLVERQEARKTK
jgi:hypothetical protein